jgi:hypothetical protein
MLAYVSLAAHDPACHGLTIRIRPHATFCSAPNDKPRQTSAARNLEQPARAASQCSILAPRCQTLALGFLRGCGCGCGCYDTNCCDELGAAQSAGSSCPSPICRPPLSGCIPCCVHSDGCSPVYSSMRNVSVSMLRTWLL